MNVIKPHPTGFGTMDCTGSRHGCPVRLSCMAESFVPYPYWSTYSLGRSWCYLPAFPVFRLDHPAHPVTWFHVAPYPQLLLSDSPTQGSQIHVAIQILDVNDNSPQLEQSYEPFACDNAIPGQVSKGSLGHRWSRVGRERNALLKRMFAFFFWPAGAVDPSGRPRRGW